ncbi:hypothetical protein BUALT_Bualt01G0136200 [Buddleja alternifolia]|uniref:RST domain-containing protein n=1 Tax=Buddleja alternifolia TaxID=168488 RepID=A0AAV6Y7V4_9LAMI|nr:hypothetical protein BUALT_Bualt01G0136200 [Buddleja alternifolia]
MDPIMKFLEEDEDETMHSGADVEAFTAELNRDIEGNMQQPSDSDSAGLSQGNNHITSQFLPQWQTSGHDGIANFQSGQDLMGAEEKEHHSSQMELQQHGSDSENRKEDNDSTHELNSLALPRQQDGQNPFPGSQPVDTQPSGEQPIHIQEPDRETNQERESQLQKLQNMSNHHSMAMSSNTQQPVSMELNDQQSLSTMNQHTTGMGISNQQAGTSGMSNSNQQQGTTLKLNKQVPFGMLLPIIQPQLDKDRAMQLHTLYFKLKKNEISKDGFVRHMRSIVGDQMLKMAVYKLQTQAARNSQTAPNQFQLQSQASGRPSSDLSNPTTESDAAKSQEVESQADSQGVPGSHISNPSSSALSQERKHPAFPTPGLNKQQHMHFSQASFPTYGSAGSSYSPFSATNISSSTSLRPQSHDSQMRQAPAPQNMSANHLGPKTQSMSMMNMPKFDRPHSFNDPKKIQGGSLTHMNSNSGLYVKQEPVDQSNEQHKAQLSSPQGISPLSSAPFKQGNAAPGNLKDESFEMQSSRTGFTPPTSLSNSRIPSLTSLIGPGNNSKAPLKKPLVGQKKPMEAPGSSPPSSKKQKVSGAFLDQSIEQLNDVTAVSGVNLREEEEQLFSGPKEDSRVSEASRRVVQEEEERLILHKIPLQKKVVEIMAKSGLKSMSNDVERCLSLCVEERMRGLIANLIRLSKQRVDIEKPRHRTIITSDVRQQIMSVNRKAREEWEKKQAETEKSQKQNEPDSSNGVDGDKEKDENRAKSAKANKEEDDKMRATAANVAVRAATGVGDMLSRWQLMIEAKQKQGGTDTSSGSQPGKDVTTRKPLQTSTRNTRENQESEKRDSSTGFSTPAASVRKVGRNQVVVPRVARSISVKDVIAILEREPQMSKSTLIYRLYDKIRSDVASE